MSVDTDDPQGVEGETPTEQPAATGDTPRQEPATEPTPAQKHNVVIRYASTDTERANAELDLAVRYARAVAFGGGFKDDRQAIPWELALTKILIGKDLGLSPTQSMMAIDMVEGQPSVRATLLAAKVNALPNKRYAVVRHTNDACEIHWYERRTDGLGSTPPTVARERHASDCPGGEQCDCNPSEQMSDERYLGSSRFDEADLKLSGIKLSSHNGDPTNHVKYPRNMKFYRALAWGQREHAPEATLGVPVYVEGEIPSPERVENLAASDLGPAVSFDDVLRLISDHDLRERFIAAYSWASQLCPGMVTATAAHLVFQGAMPGDAEAYVARIERENEKERQRRMGPADAEVVAS